MQSIQNFNAYMREHFFARALAVLGILGITQFIWPSNTAGIMIAALVALVVPELLNRSAWFRRWGWVLMFVILVLALAMTILLASQISRKLA